ncbi:hypothetical protein [Actinomadura macrotermitis]|uniref:hypothetical protein n=1 Tax=Actinomadura macrotermitis TaxID=2585200 RepID=UPI0012972417|nr:hypothetical protein [Actinomadura macrotermitis]
MLALALALTGCGGGDKKKADGKTGPPPPASTPQPESEATAAPGATSLKSSGGLRKPVTYGDKISVSVAGIRYVRDKAKGPGEITGQQLTIFTLRFSNGSGAPLDLNKVRVVARYGPKKTQASPTSYANLNDFYGTVAAGGSKAASYAFVLPPAGYKNVVLGVSFDDKHKTAVFAGSLRH